MAKASKKARAGSKISTQSPAPALDPNSPIVVATGSQTFNAFTCFPRLPIELRFVIWSMTIEPRILTAGLGEWGDHYSVERYETVKALWKTRVPVPATLHACQESRREVIKEYELWLSTGTRHLRSSRGIYFNPSMDIVLVETPTWLGTAWDMRTASLREESFRIPIVAYHWSPWYNQAHVFYDVLQCSGTISMAHSRSSGPTCHRLNALKGVERLIFVVHSKTNPSCSFKCLRYLDPTPDVNTSDWAKWAESLCVLIWPDHSLPVHKLAKRIEYRYCNQPLDHEHDYLFAECRPKTIGS